MSKTLKKMKKTIIMFVMMLGMYSSQAAMHKERSVPDAVLKSFASQYPQVTVEKWKMMGDTSIALFKENKRRDYAYYSSDGEWIKTETKIPWSKDLPCAVDYSFNHTTFKSWYIDRMAERESPVEKGEYVIQVHHDYGPDGSVPGDCESVYKLYFDSNGSLLRESLVQR
jgi:hypothetical protein